MNINFDFYSLVGENTLFFIDGRPAMLADTSNYWWSQADLFIPCDSLGPG